MPSIIQIRKLSKKYRLAENRRYLALRDVISNAGKQLFNKQQRSKEFWALKDIDLEIEKGDRVGIIGRNGAGKSTLLKILSRITPPTKGEVTLHGRVASLLEVGTGFHPELTGRENIFLNGAILGLSKKEIQQKLEEIIDFSGVENFIDTPLKHYSSGMHLRLAFSVAAHLEPEILLVDEVLAVGDAEFQQKCINKMEEVSNKDGRTILFVSHQLNSMMKLCNNGIWIDKGELQFAGTVNDTIEHYTRSLQENKPLTSYQREHKNEADFFLSTELSSPVINIGDDITVTIVCGQQFRDRKLVININILDQFGELISHIINEDDNFSTAGLVSNKLVVTLKNLNLLPGRYYLSFWAGLDMMHGIDKLERAVSFEVSEHNTFTKRIAHFPSNSKMIIRSVWQAG